MIDLADASVAPSTVRRRGRRRLLVGLVAGALVVGAGAVSATAVSLHYLHAPGLATDGGGWLPPDNAHERSVEAGQYTASVVAPRLGKTQTFEMTLYNPSSVSQTVLGLTDGADLGNPRTKAEPVHLTVSSGPTFPDNPAVTFTSKPVVIPPHGQFTLRLAHDTGHDWQGCRSEFWDGLSLQVRVGVFTRTERLDFGGLIMEIRSPGPGC